METIYDLIIIGSGPAGLAASIYAKRAMLNALTIEKNMMSGGQILNTYEVDNYPGLPGINGFDLGMRMREHADKLGALFAEDNILRVEDMGQVKKIVGESGEYLTRTIILAAGAVHRKLGIPKEEELTGRGVSYCATCDGAFFKDKITAVVGGGDVAVEDAVFLARMCKKVYLIHRRDSLRAAKTLQKQLFALDNVEILWDTTVERIEGEHQTEGVVLKKKDGKETSLAVDGVFIAVGIVPESAAFRGIVEMDEGGYIEANEDGETKTPGIFAAGDIRKKQLRQIVTAVADGANAVTSVERYLSGILEAAEL